MQFRKRLRGLFPFLKGVPVEKNENNPTFNIGMWEKELHKTLHKYEGLYRRAGSPIKVKKADFQW